VQDRGEPRASDEGASVDYTEARKAYGADLVAYDRRQLEFPGVLPRQRMELTTLADPRIEGSPRVVDDHMPQATTGAASSRTEPVAWARLGKSTPPGPGCHDEWRVLLVACMAFMT
jgi:hypothetical protein